MIQSLESLHRAAQERGSRVLAVAAAQDAEVLLAVDAARKLGIATAILVGDEEQIRAIAQAHDIPLEPHRILPEPDKVQACRTAVKLVRDGQADGRICIFDAAYPLHRNFGGMRLPLQSRGGSGTADAGIPEKAVLRHCKRSGSVLDPRGRYGIMVTS